MKTCVEMTNRQTAQKLKVDQNSQKLIKKTENRSKVILISNNNKKVLNKKVYQI